MKIIQVIDNFTAENAGVTSAVVEIAQGKSSLDKITHQVIAVGSNAVKVSEDVQVSLCAMTARGSSWRYSTEFNQCFSEAMVNADIAHIHGVWMYPQVCSANIANKISKPFIITPHNMLGGWVWQQGGLLRRIKKSVYWMAICGKPFHKATLVHALSSIERDSLKPFFPHQRIEVVPNSIDVAVVQQLVAQAETMDGLPERYMVFLGRIHPIKGLHLALEAIARLKPQDRIPLLIVGPEENKGYAAQLHDIVARAGLGAWVHFLGPMFGVKKFAILRNATALVAPSYSEGVSMAALEAMACGKAVITTQASGIDKIEEGGGIIVESEVESIMQALKRVAEWHLDEVVSRGQSALSLVEKNYSKHVVSGLYEEMYTSLK